MIDPQTTRRWGHYAIFTGLCAGLLFLHLLPLSNLPQRIPGPDFLICLIFAWVLHRPDYLPPFLIALVLISADFLLMRPPGLWTILGLLGAEFLRYRQSDGTDMPFLAEWGVVAMVITAIGVLNWAVLAIVVAPHHNLTQALIRALMSIGAYPFALVLARIIFGIRRSAAGGYEAR